MEINNIEMKRNSISWSRCRNHVIKESNCNHSVLEQSADTESISYQRQTNTLILYLRLIHRVSLLFVMLTRKCNCFWHKLSDCAERKFSWVSPIIFIITLKTECRLGNFPGGYGHVAKQMRNDWQLTTCGVWLMSVWSHQHHYSHHWFTSY